MADQTLLLLIQEIRNKTFRVLEGVDDAQSHFAPPGLNNTILWHAGHVFVVNEQMTFANITGQPPVFPDGWFNKFSWKSQPALVTSWPKLSEVVEKLKDQQQRMRAAVEELAPEQLSQIVGDPARNRTLGYCILHGLHDEANHQGEMWLLKKMYGKRVTSSR